MASETPEITKSCFKTRIEVQKQGRRPRLTFEDRLAKAREVRTIKCSSDEKIPPEDKFSNGDCLTEAKEVQTKKCSSDEKIPPEDKFSNEDCLTEAKEVQTKKCSSDEKIPPDNECVNLDIRLEVLERRLQELKEKARIKEREIRRAMELSRNRKDPESSFLNGFSVMHSSHRKHPMAKLKRKKQSSKALLRKNICSTPVQKELEEKLRPQQLQVKTESVDTQENLSTLASNFPMTPVGSSHVPNVQVKTEPLEFSEETPTLISDPLNPVKLFHPSCLEADPGENSSNWDYMVMDIEVEPDESVESLFTLVQNQKDTALFQECEQGKGES